MSNMEHIVLKNIQKVYPGRICAVHDFSLSIQQGEFLVLVGPSGCGKSTLLRMIAGLDEITSGELWIDGQLCNRVEAKSRDIAMVFQNYALYPHMTVYKNMALGLELRHISREEIDRRIQETARSLDISHLLNRKPKRLSIGQRQRVALGRAIVRDPKVFLMDEPLSNLDAELRAKIRILIGQLQRKLHATFIYVTHDQSEAMTLADRICVMDSGFIQQVDTAQNIYDYPRNLFVATFIGSPQMNLISAVLERDSNGFFFSLAGARIPLPHADSRADALSHFIGQTVIAGVRPEDLYCGEEALRCQPGQKLTAEIIYVEPLGAEQLVHVQLDSRELVIRTYSKQNLASERFAAVALNPRHIHIFSRVTHQALLH